MSEDTTAGPGVATKPTRGGNQRSAENKLRAAERSKAALELRLRRHTYDEIADRLGYSNKSAARKAVEREIAKVPREGARELLTQELETLDAIQARIIGLVLDERPDSKGVDKGPDLWAIDRLLAIMDRRAKLMGLDKIGDDSGVDEFKAVLKAWAATIAAQVDEDDAEDAAAVARDAERDSPESHA